MFPDNFPVKATAELGVTIEKHTYDFKVFPSCSVKVEEDGRFWGKTKILAHLDESGKLTRREIRSTENRLKQIAKLLEKGLITIEQAERKRNEILDEI